MNTSGYTLSKGDIHLIANLYQELLKIYIVPEGK
jgi:hypothetical protein